MLHIHLKLAVTHATTARAALILTESHTCGQVAYPIGEPKYYEFSDAKRSIRKLGEQIC
jgi:hypothetical protein